MVGQRGLSAAAPTLCVKNLVFAVRCKIFPYPENYFVFSISFAAKYEKEIENNSYLWFILFLLIFYILIYKFIKFCIFYINLKNIKRYNNIELLKINNMVNFFI